MSLVVGLSVLATVPVLQFISLGYLLEAAARVAQGGRLRDGFIGIRTAARVGGMVLSTWLFVLPLRVVADLRYSALLLGADARAARLQMALTLAAALVAAHLLWAYFRGGKLRHFLWPAPWRLVRTLREGGVYTAARNGLYEFVTGLQIGHYFSLGLRGFAIALAWLIAPITIMALATRLPEDLAVLTALAGGILLAAVLLYLPFLQVNFAADNRLQSGFDVGRVRQAFRRAPLAFWFALLATLALALPLYLLKAELLPREAAWLPSIVFVVSIYPARLLAGWAVFRSRSRELPRFFLFRWAARLGALPLVLTYALIVYFTQYISWYGAWSLYEQHAFMLPVPFVGL